jgi:hypothetical protein
MTEEWRDVVGYEDLYQVSSLGRLFAKARTSPGRFGATQKRKAHMMSAYVDKTSTGYVSASIRRDGISKKVNIHVLVLEAFVGPRPSPSHEACHCDGNRANAALSNLRWDTASANKTDMILHGTHPAGERSGKAKLTAELTNWIKESGQSSKTVAHAIGVAPSTIRAVRIGQNWGSP